MKSLWAILGLTAALSLTASRAARPDDPLRADSRLQVAITLAAVDQSLRSVLAEVQAQTSVTLAVAADVGDENVGLLVNSRPAGEILSLVADHLNLRWRRSGRGFTLDREGAERRKEESRFRQDLERDWKEVSDWTDRLIRLNRVSPQERTVRLAELHKRLAETDAPSVERARLSEEAALLRDSLRPASAPAAALLDSLTPEQLRKLMQRTNLLLAEKDGSLKPSVAALVRQTPSKDAATPDQEEYPLFADAQVEIIEGDLLQGPPKPEDRAYRLMVQLIARSEEGWRPVQWHPELPPRIRSPLTPTVTQDPQLLRSVRVQPKRAPHSGPKTAAFGAGAFYEDRPLWPDWPTVGDFARSVREASGLNVVADSFARGRVDPKLAVFTAQHPLVEILDVVCHEINYSWRKEGDTLLLRSKSAYRDRLMQIPERLLQPWRARIGRQGSAGLDDFGELAALLNDRQALGMAYYWGWYLEDAWVAPPTGSALMFYRSRRHLRFWASLSPGQRQAALAGAALPVSEMSPSQRQTFVNALLDPAASPWTPGSELLLSNRGPTAEEIDSGAFSLKEKQWRLQTFIGRRPDGRTTKIVAQHPTTRPPNLGNLPQEWEWSLQGPSNPLSSLTFQYHLGGREQPRRVSEITLARPPEG